MFADETSNLGNPDCSEEAQPGDYRQPDLIVTESAGKNTCLPYLLEEFGILAKVASDEWIVIGRKIKEESVDSFFR
jgi:hypothetical protein